MVRLWIAVWIMLLAAWQASPAPAQVEVIIGGPSPAPAVHRAAHHRRPASHPKSREPSQSAVGAARSRAIVAYALRFLGIPYVWGGASVSGFDCSGYTWFVYRTFDYPIPRTADTQFMFGRPVATPLPGDLVFFQTYDYGPSHVGIYLGDGRFVSSAAGGVHVSSFGEAYFAERYIGARRFAAID